MLEFKFNVFLIELKEIFWSFYQIVNLVFSWILDNNSIIEIDVIVESKYIHEVVIYLIWFIWKIVFVIKLVNVLILKLINHYSVSFLVAMGFLIATFFIASIITYCLLFFLFLLKNALFFFLSIFLKFAFINDFLFLFINCIISLYNSWFWNCKYRLIPNSFHKHFCHCEL